jgi:hypothetical protein
MADAVPQEPELDGIGSAHQHRAADSHACEKGKLVCSHLAHERVSVNLTVHCLYRVQLTC